MTKYKTYPTYQNSGLPFLGQIPVHWEIKQVKRIFKVTNGSTPNSVSSEYWDGNIVWITPEDLGQLQSSTILDSTRKITREGYLSCGTNLVPAGSLILSTRAPIGHLAVAGVELCTNQGCRCLIFKNGDEKRFFYYHFFSVRPELESHGRGSTFKELGKSELETIFLACPPLSEQRTIADFLDRETARIDTLIAKYQRLTELLEEKRISLISQAVTKGVDSSAQMKETGIPWLGKIPISWKISKIKYVKSKERNAFVDGPFGSNLKSIHFEPSGEVYVIESEFATTGIIEVEELKRILKTHFETIKRSETKANDIIIAKIGARFGLNSILPDIGGLAVVSGNSLKLTVDTTSCETKFIHYSLLHLKWAGAIDLLASFTAQPALSLGDMNSLSLAIPQRAEQKQIVQYIESKSKTIDSLLEKTKTIIGELKELRISTISSAVTGKIQTFE